MKLKKLSLYTQLQQTDLASRLHIAKESPNEGFNDIVFQHFVGELKN